MTYRVQLHEDLLEFYLEGLQTDALNVFILAACNVPRVEVGDGIIALIRR